MVREDIMRRVDWAKYDEKRQHILEAAEECFQRDGFRGASIGEICTAAHMSPGHLYHYFDSKEALLTACLGTVAEEAIRRLTVIASGSGTAPERLRGLIIEQLRIITVEYPELARLFLAHLEWPAAVRERIKDWHTRHDAVFHAVIDEGVKAGELADIDISLVRHNLTGSLNFVPFRPGPWRSTSIWDRPGISCCGPSSVSAATRRV